MRDKDTFATEDAVPYVEKQPWLSEWNRSGIARALHDAFYEKINSRQARDYVGRFLLALNDHQLAILPTKGNLHPKKDKHA